MAKTDRIYKKALARFISLSMAITVISGCGGSDDPDPVMEDPGREKGGSLEETDWEMELTQSEIDTEFTDREKDSGYSEEDAVQIILEGSAASADSDAVSVSGSTVTVGGEGVYIISGSLTDGQIVVDAADTDKVRLVLKGADIHCETGAAVYVKEADKVFLTLEEGTSNTLSGGIEYVNTDDNTVDGVIFSKADLAVNGSGSLDIDADYKHGIVSKDDLVITGGTITINAVSQCLEGKDGIKILDGTFYLSGQGKAVKAEHTEDPSLGNIYVAGGTFTIQTQDDAFCAGGSILLAGGVYTVETGDDAFHADTDLVIKGGDIRVVSCYEGLEGYRVVVNGGTVEITAEDDAVNAAKPNSEEEADVPGEDFEKNPMRGDSGMENDTKAYVKITGGCMTMDAGGDGIDSNGSLRVTGGVTYVNGPTDGADGALDYNGSAIVTGGTLIAVGSSGMAQGFGDASEQCSLTENLSAVQEAGSPVILLDKNGEEILNWSPQKAYQSVVITCPELELGNTYTLCAGTDSSQITLEETVTSQGNGGDMRGMNRR